MTTTYILLHGALADAGQLATIDALLASRGCQTLALTFPGHGKEASLSTTFSVDEFVTYVLRQMDERSIESARFFGYSMGGFVAAQLALRAPDRVKSIVTLGTKWHWSPEIAERETAMLRPDIIEEKVPKYAAQLRAIHGEENWKHVLSLTAGLMRELGRTNPLTPDRLAEIQCPVTVLLGEKDQMVTREESEVAAVAIPHGQFHLLPDTPHPLERANPEVIVPYL
jgi:pimeloyl-ACP methyl ester carboxylesterase